MTNLHTAYLQKLASGIIPEEDIPDIHLYMDQVTTFLEERLSPFKRTQDDKVLTKTMINNYTKAKVFPPPEKKKYTKNHIMLLIIIYHLKFVLSLSDISQLWKPFLPYWNLQLPSPFLKTLYQNFTLLQTKWLQQDPQDFLPVGSDALPLAEQQQLQTILEILSFAIHSQMDKLQAESRIDQYVDSYQNNPK